MQRLIQLFGYSAAVLSTSNCVALAQSGNADPTRDIPVIRQVLNDALSSNSNGVGTNWLNPQTHDYGIITPRTAYAASNGQQCRAYDRTWVVNGNESTYSGNACKDAQGIWRVQGIETLARQRAIPASVVPPTIPPSQPGTNAVASNQPPAVPAGQSKPAPIPPPSNVAPPPERSPNSASNTAQGQNQPLRPSPPAKSLSTTLSRDEVVALEQYLQLLGFQVGTGKGNFDPATQEAVRVFWRNQNRTGQPTVDENFLTLVQIAISADRARGGVAPVVITTSEPIGSAPQGTTKLEALLKDPH
jgi:surface antigen